MKKKTRFRFQSNKKLEFFSYLKVTPVFSLMIRAVDWPNPNIPPRDPLPLLPPLPPIPGIPIPPILLIPLLIIKNKNANGRTNESIFNIVFLFKVFNK
jgi:hypothetical protein